MSGTPLNYTHNLANPAQAKGFADDIVRKNWLSRSNTERANKRRKHKLPVPKEVYCCAYDGNGVQQYRTVNAPAMFTLVE